MKFDLGKIMRRAWEIKKDEDRKERNIKLNHNDFSPLKASEKALFSVCLEIAWEEAKKEKTIEVTSNRAKIKDWFLNKKLGKDVNNFGDEIEILKQTEKAVYGNIYYCNGMAMPIWVPKSCLC